MTSTVFPKHPSFGVHESHELIETEAMSSVSQCHRVVSGILSGDFVSFRYSGYVALSRSLQNRLEESLNLFQAICNNKFFIKTSMVSSCCVSCTIYRQVFLI